MINLSEKEFFIQMKTRYINKFKRQTVDRENFFPSASGLGKRLKKEHRGWKNRKTHQIHCFNTASE